MNIFHKRRMVSGTTTAWPFESEALEIEWCGVTFWVQIIKKTCEAITSGVPVGYEDETGFHYGVAEARLIPIRTGRNPNGRRAKPVFRRGG
jgi:hypothetical protein